MCLGLTILCLYAIMMDGLRFVCSKRCCDNSHTNLTLLSIFDTIYTNLKIFRRFLGMPFIFSVLINRG
jgi:hypothetical protein